MEGLLGGEALVVGAAGDDALSGGVAGLKAHDAESEQRVGEARCDEGEGALGILVGREDGRWDGGEVALGERLDGDAELCPFLARLLRQEPLVQDVEQECEILGAAVCVPVV